MSSTLNFLDLPADIHSTLAFLLPVPSLLALSLTCHTAYDLYANDASTRICLDGIDEMAVFHTRLAAQIKRRRCAHAKGHPDHEDPLAPPSKKLRADRIKEVSIYEMRYADDDALALDVPESDFDFSMGMRQEVLAVARLSNTLGVCPNLETLRIFQSAVPLSPSAAYAISTRAPQLKSLTFRSRHCDALSLAGLLHALGHLHTLDVSSVKTCICRGQQGQVHGAIELGLALRSHPRLQRVVFNACKVLAVDDGLLLRILSGDDKHMCEHRERLRQRQREQRSQFLQHQQSQQNFHSSAHAAVSHSDAQHQSHHTYHSSQLRNTQGVKQDVADYEGPSIRLQSMEFRRSPVHGRPLMRYLRSAPAASLNHLFIGGCKQVRPGHLILATQTNHGQHGIASSMNPLHLELDGRLLTKEMLRNLSHRITQLRVFEPTLDHLKVLVHVLKSGGLHRMSDLVILPRETDVPEWSPLSRDVADTAIEAEGPLLAHTTKTGELRRYMEYQLGLINRHAPVDLTIGDEAWHDMQQCKEELRFWAQVQLQEEEEEMMRASGLYGGQDKAGVPLTSADWSGAGIDVWR